MRLSVVTFLLLATALAGCTDGNADGDGDDVDDPSTSSLQLRGWVFDQALAPIQDVAIEASGGNALAEALTNADGYYEFSDLPIDTAMVLIARADGFIPQSKGATLTAGTTVELNFTMEPEPVITPYHDTVPRDLFISCQYRMEITEQKFDNECGTASNDNEWQITVGKDFAGGVVELKWQEGTLLGTSMHVTIECATPAACGDRIEPFAEAIGPAEPLRVEISNLVASKWFPDGGIMLLRVYVDPNNDANEAGISVAFAATQEVKAIASLFYHEPPPAGYSIEG